MPPQNAHATTSLSTNTNTLLLPNTVNVKFYFVIIQTLYLVKLIRDPGVTLHFNGHTPSNA